MTWCALIILSCAAVLAIINAIIPYYRTSETWIVAVSIASLTRPNNAVAADFLGCDTTYTIESAHTNWAGTSRSRRVAELARLNNAVATNCLLFNLARF